MELEERIKKELKERPELRRKDLVSPVIARNTFNPEIAELTREKYWLQELEQRVKLMEISLEINKQYLTLFVHKLAKKPDKPIAVQNLIIKIYRKLLKEVSK